MLKSLAQKLAQTKLLGVLPGGQLASQSLDTLGAKQPTVGDVAQGIAKTYIYNPEEKKILPQSLLLNLARAESPEERQSLMTSAAMALTASPTSNYTKLKAPAYGTSEKGRYFMDLLEGSGADATKTVKTYGPYSSSKIANNMRNNYIPLEGNQRIGLPYNRPATPQTAAQFEVAEGWKPGQKAVFDTALLDNNAEKIRQMLPEVPQEYQKRMAELIEKALKSLTKK